MSQKYEAPITAHNFQEAWAYAAETLRNAKISYKTDRVADPISHFVFLVSMLFCTLGMAYAHLLLPGVQAFFQKAPAFLTLWTKFYTAVLGKAESIWIQAGICLVSVWVLSCVFALIGAGLVRLLYHPDAPEAPNYPKASENARYLMEHVKSITKIKTKARTQAGAKCNILYIVTVAVAVTLYIFFLSSQNMLNTEALMGDPMFYLYVLCAVFAILALYSLANYPVVLLLRRLSQCKVPAELFKDAESYLKYTVMLEQPAAVSQQAAPEAEVTEDVKV